MRAPQWNMGYNAHSSGCSVLFTELCSSVFSASFSFYAKEQVTKACGREMFVLGEESLRHPWDESPCIVAILSLVLLARVLGGQRQCLTPLCIPKAPTWISNYLLNK